MDVITMKTMFDAFKNGFFSGVKSTIIETLPPLLSFITRFLFHSIDNFSFLTTMEQRLKQVKEKRVNEQKESIENEEDEIDFASIYIDENYELYEFYWNHVHFSIYHLNTSSTQYDLTGQIIWPASEVLARFLIDKSEELNLSEKKMLELGSGAGLSGFAGAYAGCKVNVLTDDFNLPVIERLLIKNVEHVQLQLNNNNNNNNRNDAKIAYAPLRWGKESELENIKKQYGTFDIIIGADTVYWPNSVTPLLQSIDFLLSKHKDAKCYLAYVERSTRTCNELLNTAQKIFHFHIEYLPDEEVDHKYKINHLTAEKVKMILMTRD
jgi:predicted nicotinamide N-methyase